MQIYGLSQLHGAQSVNAPHSTRPAQSATPTASAPIQDEVNISDAARLAEQVHQIPDVRQDRVNSIRAQIANGTYESPDKLDLAMERLLDEIG